MADVIDPVEHGTVTLVCHGQPFEVKKEFEIDGLDGVLKEMQKKR